MLKNDLTALIHSLSLEEKAALCSGKGLWQTKAIPEKGIPEIWMADGSNGIRIQKPKNNQRAQAASDFLKITDLTQDSATITEQEQAVCYPSGAAVAATWDAALIRKMGETLADECRYRKVHILLAPGINIKRSPLCGRGYEYYSEDPCLTGVLATAFIAGVQSRGIGTSIKHFAANNAETLRINMSSDMDERTLREIYLAPFEMAVREADPWTVMSSYNKINGIQMAENPGLLTGILRNEWGYEGTVVCDWGGIKDRVTALRAGNDLQMPENRNDDELLVQAVKSGELTEAELNLAVERILKLVFRAKTEERWLDTLDWEDHRKTARQIAADSIVLLKNEGDLLPLTAKKYKKIAVLGAFAKEPRYQGGGSTLVNPIRISSPWEELLARADGAIDLSYAPGYQIRNEATTEMLEEACNTAADADVALIFAGLWVAYDREGFDRKKLEIDSTHGALIRAVKKVQKNVIVVLNSGDAVTMEDWINDAGALVQQLLVGETVGEALADVLFGVVNPSGRLPVTYPKRLEDTPGWPWFPGECGHHIYGEGILAGYRYYHKKNIEPRFPFGYGLSYTNFVYHDLKLHKTAILDTETLKAEVRLGNTGNTSGKEVVQLYVAAPPCRLLRADRELRRFAKIELRSGESGTIVFELGFRDFAYYDPEIGDWYVETGEYRILVCKNAEEVCLSATVRVTGTKSGFRPLYLDSQHRQVFEHPQSKKMYLDFLVRKGVLKVEAVDHMIPLLNGNYMGIYNVVTSLLGVKISKAEMQELLDAINQTLKEK